MSLTTLSIAKVFTNSKAVYHLYPFFNHLNSRGQLLFVLFYWFKWNQTHVCLLYSFFNFPSYLNHDETKFHWGDILPCLGMKIWRKIRRLWFTVSRCHWINHHYQKEATRNIWLLHSPAIRKISNLWLQFHNYFILLLLEQQNHSVFLSIIDFWYWWFHLTEVYRNAYQGWLCWDCYWIRKQ